ncbi:MAG: tRNA-dihydrouridine synthase family protein [Spirochaetaceae bacterium]|nr:tRNA-dihydrouridine synthase family protein [Spirochaetaceae bacterium]
MNLLLAPMATITHEPLRRLIAEFGGVDEYYTEMIHAPSLIHDGPFEKYYLLTSPEPEKIVWQLTGGKEGPLVEAAKIVCERGGIGVDINMGCAALDIFNQGAGCAWMFKDFSEIRSMLSKVYRVIQNTSCNRLSVKMRLGGEDFTEESLFAFTDMLIEEGVSQIVLHPRTRKEKFRRSARWEYVEQLKRHVQEKFGNEIKIIGNGDVSSVSKIHDYSKKYSLADGIMIGRGALQMPWIFAEAKGILFESPIDLYGVAERFFQYLQEGQPKEFYLSRLQRFFAGFCDNFSFAHHIKTTILREKTGDAMLQRLAEYFEQVPQDRFKK